MKAEEITEYLLENAKEQAQANSVEYSTYLIRFTHNRVHQPVYEEGISSTVKVVKKGKKIGEASSNSREKEALLNMLRKAEEIAELSPPKPDFVSLPTPSPPRFQNPFTPPPSPLEGAELVKEAIRIAENKGVNLAGSFSSNEERISVRNSLGINSFAQRSYFSLTLVATKEDGSGFAEALSDDWRRIDPVTLAEEAVERALASVHPQPIEPGVYEVLLLPYAVDEIMLYLGWFGFNARAVQEGRSFLEGRIGKRIFDENISIVDDAKEGGLPFPFDWEGVAKQRVELVDKGIAKGVVYDSFTALKEGKTSTGHATRSEPFPSDMILSEGDVPFEELLSSLERGILVTRFHYTNIVHPKSLVVTGMTRDGTFYVEKGRVKFPLKNLRFTQNLLEALSQGVILGKGRKRGYYSLVPPLRLSSFTFTGVSNL